MLAELLREEGGANKQLVCRKRRFTEIVLSAIFDRYLFPRTMRPLPGAFEYCPLVLPKTITARESYRGAFCWRRSPADPDSSSRPSTHFIFWLPLRAVCRGRFQRSHARTAGRHPRRWTTAPQAQLSFES